MIQVCSIRKPWKSDKSGVLFLFFNHAGSFCQRVWSVSTGINVLIIEFHRRHKSIIAFLCCSVCERLRGWEITSLQQISLHNTRLFCLLQCEILNFLIICVHHYLPSSTGDSCTSCCVTIYLRIVPKARGSIQHQFHLISCIAEEQKPPPGSMSPMIPKELLLCGIQASEPQSNVSLYQQSPAVRLLLLGNVWSPQRRSMWCHSGLWGDHFLVGEVTDHDSFADPWFLF